MNFVKVIKRMLVKVRDRDALIVLLMDMYHNATKCEDVEFLRAFDSAVKRIYPHVETNAEAPLCNPSPDEYQQKYGTRIGAFGEPHNIRTRVLTDTDVLRAGFDKRNVLMPILPTYEQVLESMQTYEQVLESMQTYEQMLKSMREKTPRSTDGDFPPPTPERHPPKKRTPERIMDAFRRATMSPRDKQRRPLRIVKDEEEEQ